MAEQDPTRRDFKVFYPVTTRWMDNDLYGHVNNVTYYAYFDSAINTFLIAEGGLNIHQDDVVGFVASSACTYRKPVAFPQRIEAGLKVDRLGSRSVHYGVAIFAEGDEAPSAFGHVVHVFVSRRNNASTAIPDPIRTALARIVAAS